MPEPFGTPQFFRDRAIEGFKLEDRNREPVFAALALCEQVARLTIALEAILVEMQTPGQGDPP